MLKIGLPNTPSCFVGKEKIIKAQKVLMTCGGGMGGTQWNEYIVDFPDYLTPNDTLIDVTNYLGEKIKLNVAYIVKVSDTQIVSFTTDSKNPHNKGKFKFFYETPIDNKVILVREFLEGNKEFTLLTKLAVEEV